MKKSQTLKLMGLLIVIVTILTLLNGKNDKDIDIENTTVAFENTAAPVVKIHESNGFPKLDEILKDPRLQGATTGISIRNASTGEIVYSHLGDTRVHPASVMKLLTGATALDTLGENHVFKTELYTDGRITNGLLYGNLYLKGKGDPTLTKDGLNAFASELKAKGIRSIKGNLYADDTWFDSDRLSQDLNWSDEPFYTGSQVSALTLSPNDDYDAGTVIVEVNPTTKSGQAGKVKMVPANTYLTIINNTQTVAKGGKKNIRVERRHGSNTIVVSGTIPVGAKKTRSWSSVWEPANYTVNVFQAVLEEQGIKFSEVPKMERKKVPAGATLLASRQSIPLKELLIPFLKLSNNGHAEVLVKEMGRVIGGKGSWDKGLAVMHSTIADMGIDSNNMLLRDGSGMSHKNLVTANEVSMLLHKVQSKSWYPTFLNALPVAGNKDRFVGGTLRNRMKGTAAEGNVRAKTGALNGVTALSGFVTTVDGEKLIFSIMINNYLSESTYEVMDTIVVALSNYKMN